MTVVSKPSPVRKPAHSRATSARRLRNANDGNVGARQQDPRALPEAHTPPIPTSPEEALTRHPSQMHVEGQAGAPRTGTFHAPWRFTPGHVGTVGRWRPDLMSPSPLESPLLAPPWPPILLLRLKELARAGLVSREDHLPHGCVQLPGQ